MKELIKIVKLLKPKFYNRITYVLIICGTTLLTKPIWIDLLNFAIKVFIDTNNKVQLEILGQWDWLIGLVIIIIGLCWNTKNRLIDLKSPQISEPAYKKVSNHICETFEEICQKLRPILKDNEYIFNSVGPNSNSRSTGELRTDLTLWHKYRNQSILPNNRAIKDIIKINILLFGANELLLAKGMIIHIDAFEEHIKNPEFDYSKFQFPQEFAKLIEKTCFNNSLSNSLFIKRKKWLVKRLNKININDWYIFGSSIFIPEQAKDFDIVLLCNYEITKNFKDEIDKIKLNFKIKFDFRLHVTVFSSFENEQFKDFINYNEFKINGNG